MKRERSNESGEKQEFDFGDFDGLLTSFSFEFNETSSRSLLCVSSVKERQKVGFQKVIQNELKEKRENEKMYFRKLTFPD